MKQDIDEWLHLIRDCEAGRWIGQPELLINFPGRYAIARGLFEYKDGTRQRRAIHLDDGGAGVLALTEKGEVVLLEIPRLSVAEVHCLELPGGGIGNHLGKTRLQVAQEELLEETGMVAFDWQETDTNHLWRFPSISTCGHQTFFARGARGATEDEWGDIKRDEDEKISRVVLVPFNEAYALIGTRIRELITVDALRWLMIQKLEGKIQ